MLPDLSASMIGEILDRHVDHTASDRPGDLDVEAPLHTASDRPGDDLDVEAPLLTAPPGFGDEDDVVFPPVKRNRAGRPVNSTKTNVIGLATGVKAFEKKSKHQQQQTVLNMLLKSPLKGKKRRLGDKYDRDDIKDDIKDISSATMNDDIDVGLIFPKLTEGARQKVSSLVSKLKELGGILLSGLWGEN